MFRLLLPGEPGAAAKIDRPALPASAIARAWRAARQFFLSALSKAP